MAKQLNNLKLQDISKVKSSFESLEDLIYKSKVVIKDTTNQSTGFVNAILCLAEEIKKLKDEKPNNL